MTRIAVATTVAGGAVAVIAAVLWLMELGSREQLRADRDVIAAAVAEAERWCDISRQWEDLCRRQQARIAELERSSHPSAKYPLHLRLRPERSN